MDTEEGSADVDVAVVATEAEEGMQETANHQTEDAEDIVVAATRKQCSNCSSQRPAYVYETGKSFLALYQKLLATNLLSRNWDEKQTQHRADVCDYFHLLLF
jgi:type IV secretory pathway TraG/TraD family ATPase VirD4